MSVVDLGVGAVNSIPTKITGQADVTAIHDPRNKPNMLQIGIQMMILHQGNLPKFLVPRKQLPDLLNRILIMILHQGNLSKFHVLRKQLLGLLNRILIMILMR
jgi:hypothetical protein